MKTNLKGNALKKIQGVRSLRNNSVLSKEKRKKKKEKEKKKGRKKEKITKNERNKQVNKNPVALFCQNLRQGPEKTQKD